MRTAPAIRERRAAPGLGDLVAILGAQFDAWRLRRITAGLRRAAARGDEMAVARWAARGDRALADLESCRSTCKAAARFPCNAESRVPCSPVWRVR